VRHGRRLIATPLLVALLAIEGSDIFFAAASIPSAFATTRDPFLLFPSNILAVLGLRSLYVVLAGSVRETKALRRGLAAVLLIAGAKIVVEPWIHVPAYVPVAAISACLVVAWTVGRLAGHAFLR